MESTEHLVAIKVMRLTRPSLASSLVVTAESKDLPGNLFNNELKQSLTQLHGIETVNFGQFLLLPQSFSNIYLGETFSSYICVHNEIQDIVKDVSIKADLQIGSQHIPLLQTKTVPELKPNEILDNVIHHEVKEIGTHILICEVSYLSPSGITATFKKFYKFNVFKPLDVKTKFYNAENDDIYLEAQVQNITSVPICLEKVSLDSSNLFTVTPLNTTDTGDSVFGETNDLHPNACFQYLYCLKFNNNSLDPAKSNENNLTIGKLDIIWRSNLGERGRLQTSPLQKMGSEYPDIQLNIKKLPNIVILEEKFSFTLDIINTGSQKIELSLELNPKVNKYLKWCCLSGYKVAELEPNSKTEITLDMVPLKCGMGSISGIKLIDSLAKRTHEFDEIAQVFILKNNVNQLLA